MRRGDSFQLNCRAIGEPPLVVTWTRDRQPFSPNLEPRYVVQELNTKEVLEYKIHVATAERRDSSLFSCYAENAFGRDDTNFQASLHLNAVKNIVFSISNGIIITSDYSKWLFLPYYVYMKLYTIFCIRYNNIVNKLNVLRYI